MLLLIFFVGFGLWIRYFVLGDTENAIHNNNEVQQEKKFLLNIQQKVFSEQATAEEIWIYARAIVEYEVQNLINLNLHSPQEYDDAYVGYLIQAIDKGSVEAMLDYSFYLANKNCQFLYFSGVSAEEQLENEKALIQSAQMAERAFEKQCKVYKSMKFPNLHNYSNTEKVKAFNPKMHWIDSINDYAKAKGYDEIAAATTKAIDTYEKNCTE